MGEQFERNFRAPRRNVPTCRVRLVLRQKETAWITADRVRECIEAVTDVDFEVENIEECPDIDEFPRKTVAIVRCASLQDATTVYVKCFDKSFSPVSGDRAEISLAVSFVEGGN